AEWSCWGNSGVSTGLGRRSDVTIAQWKIKDVGQYGCNCTHTLLLSVTHTHTHTHTHKHTRSIPLSITHRQHTHTHTHTLSFSPSQPHTHKYKNYHGKGANLASFNPLRFKKKKKTYKS